MVEDEELEAIARRHIDSNQFMTIGTSDEEGVPWVSPVWYAPAHCSRTRRRLPPGWSSSSCWEKAGRSGSRRGDASSPSGRALGGCFWLTTAWRVPVPTRRP